MNAMLDWSYDLIAEPERAVFRRLSLLCGPFTMVQAGEIAHDDGLGDGMEVSQILDQLVAKSLVHADTSQPPTLYRLLDTTRAYAQSKLVASGEAATIARRHALSCQRLLSRDQDQPNGARRPAPPSITDLANVRAALDWAFSPDGDAAIGVSLTAAAAPIWIGSSHLKEAQSWLEQAITALPDNVEPEVELALHAALGSTLLYTKGPGPEIEAAWTRAFELADTLNNTDQRLNALWGVWTNRVSNFQLPGALPLAQRFREIAAGSSDQNSIHVGDRLIGTTLFFVGDFSGARRHIETMLGHYDPPAHLVHIARFHFNQVTRATSTLAEIYWLQGAPERAARMAEDNVGNALGGGHELSLCTALGQGACPISLHTGDLVAAEKYAMQLLESSARRGLTRWHAWARCFNGLLDIQKGDVALGVQRLRAVFAEFPDTTFAVRFTSFLGDLARALSLAGDVGGALTTIEDAIARSDRTEDRFCIAELLRIKGEILLLEGTSGSVAQAELAFKKSLDWSKRQDARSWGLRTSISLARFYAEHGRELEAHELLSTAYGQFEEGFETADLRAAKALLNEMA
jgi:predicted ATPase